MRQKVEYRKSNVAKKEIEYNNAKIEYENILN